MTSVFNDIDSKYETLVLDNLHLFALSGPLPWSFAGSPTTPPLSFSLSLSQIIYIRFVLCRLRSHADEGLRSLQGLGALTVSFAGILPHLFSALLHLLQFRLKPPVKCAFGSHPPHCFRTGNESAALAALLNF